MTRLLWFLIAALVVAATPSASASEAAGTFAEFGLGGDVSGPLDITAGPDGNLWFTEYLNNRIGRITPSGALTEFAVPTPEAFPADIALGADGNVWFVETRGNNVGRITPTGAAT